MCNPPRTVPGDAVLSSIIGDAVVERDTASEFHHLQPFAREGAHALDNVALLCRAHNHHMAERDFGERFMRRKTQESANPSAKAGGNWIREEFADR